MHVKMQGSLGPRTLILSLPGKRSGLIGGTMHERNTAGDRHLVRANLRTEPKSYNTQTEGSLSGSARLDPNHRALRREANDCSQTTEAHPSAPQHDSGKSGANPNDHKRHRKADTQRATYHQCECRKQIIFGLDLTL
jgi:hypothetical protein